MLAWLFAGIRDSGSCASHASDLVERGGKNLARDSVDDN